MPLLVEDNGAALKTPVQYLLLGAKAQDVEDLCSGRPGRAAGTRPTSATQRQPQGQPAADPRVRAASGAWDPAANGRAARAHAHSLPGAPSAQTQERTCWTSAGLSGNSSFASGVSSTRWPETCGGCSSWRTRPPATSSLRTAPDLTGGRLVWQRERPRAPRSHTLPEQPSRADGRTQCSWASAGQPRPALTLGPTPLTRGLIPSSASRGSGLAPPAWPGCTEGNRLPWGRWAPGSSCQCLRTSFFLGNWWGWVPRPGSLNLCCYVFLLPDWAPWRFPVPFGWGSRFPPAPCLGPAVWEQLTPVPSIELSSLPSFPGPQTPQPLPWRVSRLWHSRVVGEEPVSHLLP